MKYTIEDNRLILSVDATEQAVLREIHDDNPDEFDRDHVMHDILENLVTNDSFYWIDAGSTGDLTDAPMLALLGDEERGEYAECSGLWHCGCYAGQAIYQPVLYRWAFMDYALSTPQRELMETGRAIWDGGRFLEREGQMSLCYTEREFTGKYPL